MCENPSHEVLPYWRQPEFIEAERFADRRAAGLPAAIADDRALDLLATIFASGLDELEGDGPDAA